MPPMLLGLGSALIATLCFGSFAVPVKSPACTSINNNRGIHPLAFQTYKSGCCLLTSWLIFVIPQYDEDTNGWKNVTPSVTPWGIVSGLFWVPGGVAAIYAVQNAGLAVAQGTWSTLIVLVSFVWGIFIFSEEVKSIPLTCLSALIMVLGLVGMSRFSVPNNKGDEEGRNKVGKYSPLNNDNDDTTNYIADSNPHLDSILNSSPPQPPSTPSSTSSTKRYKGLLAALFNGVWGGSIMVPMHYAPPEAQGLGYVLSFALGASFITFCLWVGVWVNYRFNDGEPVPNLHFRVMWKEGILAGTLWSIGNVASMVSVQVLEEAVGYSICQSSLLISGLWGIFWFKEVRGVNRIYWGLSAVMCLLGIVGLTAMHKGDGEGESGGAG